MVIYGALSYFPPELKSINVIATSTSQMECFIPTTDNFHFYMIWMAGIDERSVQKDFQTQKHLLQSVGWSVSCFGAYEDNMGRDIFSEMFTSLLMNINAPGKTGSGYQCQGHEGRSWILFSSKLNVIFVHHPSSQHGKIVWLGNPLAFKGGWKLTKLRWQWGQLKIEAGMFWEVCGMKWCSWKWLVARHCVNCYNLRVVQTRGNSLTPINVGATLGFKRDHSALIAMLHFLITLYFNYKSHIT